MLLGNQDLAPYPTREAGVLDHEDGEVRVTRNTETVLVVTEERVQPQLGLENTGKPDDAKVCAMSRTEGIATPGGRSSGK